MIPKIEEKRRTKINYILERSRREIKNLVDVFWSSLVPLFIGKGENSNLQKREKTEVVLYD